MRGGADLILQGNRSLQTAKLTEAWRPPLQCRQWSVHCLGDTNTCGIRYGPRQMQMTAREVMQDLHSNAMLEPAKWVIG